MFMFENNVLIGHIASQQVLADVCLDWRGFIAVCHWFAQLDDAALSDKPKHLAFCQLCLTVYTRYNEYGVCCPNQTQKSVTFHQQRKRVNHNSNLRRSTIYAGGMCLTNS